MKWLSLVRLINKLARSESGDTLITTLVALLIVGVTATAFLDGLATTSKATAIADKLSTAESLAKSEMDWVKEVPYVSDATTYSAMPIPDGNDYTGYTVNITAAPLNTPDDGIQKIVVTVRHLARDEIKLEGYKVAR
jgi:type II secretory pathway pseudopilin PulG